MKDVFKEKKIKATKQRRKIYELISSLDYDASLKNIVLKAQEIDSSTIYRILEVFLKENIIEKRVNFHDEIYYALKEEHGHYFTCIKCHKKEKLEECPLEIIDGKYNNSGYKVLNHVVLIDGICKECNHN